MNSSRQPDHPEETRFHVFLSAERDADRFNTNVARLGSLVDLDTIRNAVILEQDPTARIRLNSVNRLTHRELSALENEGAHKPS